MDTNRLTIQDLAGMLAASSGEDSMQLERFIREWIALLAEQIETDGFVQVNGLGTFKVITVEPRDSVHIHTGERIVIPAHGKVVFIPEKHFREQVNKPFSFFETVELVGSALQDVAEEASASESEEGKPAIAGDDAVFSPSQIPVETTPAEMPLSQPVAAEPASDLASASSFAGRLERADRIPEEPEPDSVLSTAEAYNARIQKIIHKRYKIAYWRRWRLNSIYLFLALLFLLVAAGVVYILNDQENPWESGCYDLSFTAIPDRILKAEKPENRMAGLDTVAGNVDKDVFPEDTVVLQTDTVGRVEKDFSETQPFPEEKVIARVPIEKGSRLTLISLEYYGHKIFWVYLYDFNKAKIQDPNNIPIGTVIEVPDPELYRIDAKDRLSFERAALRQSEILARPFE